MSLPPMDHHPRLHPCTCTSTSSEPHSPCRSCSPPQPRPSSIYLQHANTPDTPRRSNQNPRPPPRTSRGSASEAFNAAFAAGASSSDLFPPSMYRLPSRSASRYSSAPSAARSNSSGRSSSSSSSSSISSIPMASHASACNVDSAIDQLPAPSRRAATPDSGTDAGYSPIAAGFVRLGRSDTQNPAARTQSTPSSRADPRRMRASLFDGLA